MKNNLQVRKSIRLRDHDYSKSGSYFITICTQYRNCLFGKIADFKMQINDAGEMIEKWYHELENKFPKIQCRENIVMPNHFHCKIDICRDGPMRPSEKNNHGRTDAHTGASLQELYGVDNKKFGSSIFDIIDWFKTMTTNEYIRGVKNKKWKCFNKRLWQKRYWDHVIRNKNEFLRISKYIQTNPENWGLDKLNKDSENTISEYPANYGTNNESWMV